MNQSKPTFKFFLLFTLITLLLTLLVVGLSLLVIVNGQKAELVAFMETELLPALKSGEADKLNAISIHPTASSNTQTQRLDMLKDSLGTIRSLELQNARLKAKEAVAWRLANVRATGAFEKGTAGIEFVAANVGGDWRLMNLTVGGYVLTPITN